MGPRRDAGEAIGRYPNSTMGGLQLEQSEADTVPEAVFQMWRNGPSAVGVQCPTQVKAPEKGRATVPQATNSATGQ